MNFARFTRLCYKGIGQFITRKLKKNIQEISPGRVYFYGKRRHQASRPGDPPNRLTGALQRSIKPHTLHDFLKIVEGGRKAPHAFDLEFGNLQRNLKPRPNMQTVIKKNKSVILNVVKKNIKNELKQGFNNARAFTSRY